MNIGFIGAGKMAQALAIGMARQSSSGQIDSSHEFWISDPDSDACGLFRSHIGSDFIVNEAESNQAVMANAEFVFLAVKPQTVERALADFGSRDVSAGTIVVSIVAGISIARISKMLGFNRVVRVMPNTPCLIGLGTCGVAASPEVGDEQLARILRLLESVGTVRQVSESQLDAVTGLSGSGPAYVYTFIEALAEGGVLNGLPHDVARGMALETVLGTAELVRQSSVSIDTLRDRVTSPGGTTLAGLAALEKSGFRDAVVNAVTAATERSRELGGN